MDERGYDFIGVSAVGLVHDGHGKLLLQKRGPEARDERGHWDLCGGAVEFGDTIEQTLLRELKEELCVQPQHMELLTAYDAHRNFHGRASHWIAVVYAVQVEPAAVKIGEPHKIAELGWFTAATLPDPLHSQFHKSFTVALDRGIIAR